MTKLERLGEDGFYYESGTGEVCATDGSCMVWTYDGPKTGKEIRKGLHTEYIENREKVLAGLSFPWRFDDPDVFALIKRMKMSRSESRSTTDRGGIVLYYDGDGTALYSEDFRFCGEQVPDVSGRFAVQVGGGASFVVPAWYLKEFAPKGGLRYGDKAIEYETSYKGQRYTVVVTLVKGEYVQHYERVLRWHKEVSK